ncbi:Uncharacterised protein [Mesomycoplasma conjunctivae]|uniref:Uncharacterized protein n=1 Tax=Mesomycoplasma conjunctivae (strain ATCC 25834 / NCTC 10147 / HRC/581) TaxID=572263 RepID=C5J610_MESCH|nr:HYPOTHETICAL PROTEIN MCJ_002110 [Mesomycoplasma conjunctivae]VEU66015.1 Uncharacterised protein [Mesomycoplasma conjunctivae]
MYLSILVLTFVLFDATNANVEIPAIAAKLKDKFIINFVFFTIFLLNFD